MTTILANLRRQARFVSAITQTPASGPFALGLTVPPRSVLLDADGAVDVRFGAGACRLSSGSAGNGDLVATPEYKTPGNFYLALSLSRLSRSPAADSVRALAIAEGSRSAGRYVTNMQQFGRH